VAPRLAGSFPHAFSGNPSSKVGANLFAQILASKPETLEPRMHTARRSRNQFWILDPGSKSGTSFGFWIEDEEGFHYRNILSMRTFGIFFMKIVKEIQEITEE
jgi:hypothetical protein